MRPRICRKRVGVKWLSASCKERRERERRVGSDDDGLSATLTAIDYREVRW